MTSATPQERPRIAIIGGGLAGLAAAVAAVERGMGVSLFERMPTLGGRAGSFVDSETGDTIDYCQHVVMGCCTEFLDFCRTTGIDHCFDRVETLHFIAPDGRRCDFTPARWLPPPLHLVPGLLGLSYLSWSEKWGIVRAMRKLIGKGEHTTGHGPHPNPLPMGEGTDSWNDAKGEGTTDHGPNPLPMGEGTVGEWLRGEGQADRAIERFWSVVLVSALGETVDRASLAAARKVFRDGFCASREAGNLILPRRPLVEIFHDRLGVWFAENDVAVHLGSPVRKIEGGSPRPISLVLADDARMEFDFAIVAVPWRSVRSLMSEELLARIPSLAEVERIEPGAITAIHLWFDRRIARLPHAALVGRLGQWLFTRPCDAVDSLAVELAGGNPTPQYHQVVVSASHRLPARKPSEWLADIRRELESAWPEACQARLLHSRVVTMPTAVFSVTPECDRWRPPQRTPVENLCLAGDWTQTGWPATMEGAVRSGRQAVELLMKRASA
jgi:squalene-associated FAD-dependent desaturase